MTSSYRSRRRRLHALSVSREAKLLRYEISNGICAVVAYCSTLAFFVTRRSFKLLTQFSVAVTRRLSALRAGRFSIVDAWESVNNAAPMSSNCRLQAAARLLRRRVDFVFPNNATRRYLSEPLAVRAGRLNESAPKHRVP